MPERATSGRDKAQAPMKFAFEIYIGALTKGFRVKSGFFCILLLESAFDPCAAWSSARVIDASPRWANRLTRSVPKAERKRLRCRDPEAFRAKQEVGGYLYVMIGCKGTKDERCSFALS